MRPRLQLMKGCKGRVISNRTSKGQNKVELGVSDEQLGVSVILQVSSKTQQTQRGDNSLCPCLQYPHSLKD